ncbi:hypothetical protein BDV12DRAFT_184566 [Aspergillus spectabilis]
MGIPRLRQHLLPFSQTVLLQSRRGPDQENLPCLSSMVIDGPSLVYNIYWRLLSWFSVSGYNVMDALPTCDEVSRGVILYLVHLKMLGVDIKGVYFDGALPAQKHETRLARLENQRRKLEIFCAATKNGFKASENTNYERIIKPQHVLRSRPSSTKYGNLPTNAFMVSAVLEDLKYRWDRDNIASVAGDLVLLPDHEGRSWAQLTTMVPGEADAYCAYAARLTGSCILTNDSDLLLYDLGDQGSVVFLDSVELSIWDSTQPLQSQIKAAMLRPSLVVDRLGISSLLSLAYELKAHPEIGLVELLRRSKSSAAMAGSSAYQRFVEEYQIDNCVQEKLERPLAFLDTRISELFWQYESRCEGARRTGDDPHVYLPILNEDHSRRCAWVKGRLYRNVAYSILNLSRPYSERRCYITEFIRRGQRIVEDRVQLRDEKWISAQLKSVSGRLESLQAGLGTGSEVQEFWTTFALYDSCVADTEVDHCDIPNLKKKFIGLGYTGKRLEWANLHLTAQTHAVLYSLRILKQLLSFSGPDDTIALDLRNTLKDLPPLHVMTGRACQRAKSCTTGISAAQLSGTFGCSVEVSRSRYQDTTDETDRHDLYQHSPSIASIAQEDARDHVLSLKNVSNIYDLLQEQ